jgi:hypothetical protein
LNIFEVFGHFGRKFGTNLIITDRNDQIYINMAHFSN